MYNEIQIKNVVCDKEVKRGFTRWIKHKNNPHPEFNEGCKENYPVRKALGIIFGKRKDAERDKLRNEARASIYSCIN